MAGIWLTYLNSQQGKALLAVPSPGAQGTGFLEYCSVSWAHAKRGLSDSAISLVVELLKEDYGAI